MGYAGNTEPQFIMPSCIAIKEKAQVGDQAIRRLGKGVEDLDFYIGDEALDATAYSVKVLLHITLGATRWRRELKHVRQTNISGILTNVVWLD